MEVKKAAVGLGKRISDVNKSFDSTKSLTDILKSFSSISKEYTDMINNKNMEFKYSNYNYKDCSQEEKDDFDMHELNKVETLVLNKIYDHDGIIRNWKYVYDLLTDDNYANTDKVNRKVVYFTNFDKRPTGDQAYLMWNGIQIIDLDIKDANIAYKLKPLLFDSLKKHNWFLGCCVSASKKSLHVWTKIDPISNKLDKRKIEFMCNFRHKYSYIYMVMKQYSTILGYSSQDIFKYLDMAMAKPQQGIFISSDKDAMINMNFKNLRIDVNFESAFDSGVESIDWINYPDLKNTFAKLEWFRNEEFNNDVNLQVTDLANTDERDISKNIAKHYKHNQRWQLANTLNALFGADKAFEYFKTICSGTQYAELKGDIKTASIHNKPISIWAIRELNQYHGFKIKIENSEIYTKELETISGKIEAAPKEDLTKIINDSNTQINLYLAKNQYLSDIKDQIMQNLKHITLLEAGAGYGKTEMIKAFNGKTLLILPFTSTIKAKIEASEVTSNWLYYYGSKRPTLDELLGPKSMSMTIDKFSKLNLMELDAANFEYIVLDESHLLFTSSYRDVMSPCIQRLANCKSKVIMMTGTPTGEMIFFPSIQHIKVKKEDFRIKQFDLYMVHDDAVKMIEIAKSMAQDIIDGKKILFPTNNGNLYYDQIIGIINHELTNKCYSREINHFYYKKSNFGDNSMDDININKTVGENDIVFCTTYLSVGVDICDQGTFAVYFDERWIPQDIEQFANRLRNNNLYIKMFLPKCDNAGIPINYSFTQPLNLSFDQDQLLYMRDITKMANDVLERNNEDSKYNPVLLSLLGQNKFLKYDENECKYFIDETTYKLSIFEERYSDYVKQLEIMLRGIKYYGYEYFIHEIKDEIPLEYMEEVKKMLEDCRKYRYNYNTVETLIYLSHITDANIDLYKEMLSGNYDIYKSDSYKEIRGDNNLYVKDIEIVEKNTPIVISLYKYYEIKVIQDIYRSCIDKSNKINYTKLERIRRLVILNNAIKKKKLDIPVLRFVQEVKRWIEKNHNTTKEDITKFLQDKAVEYANSVPNVVISDIKFLEEIFEIIKDLWSIIVKQDRPKNGKIDVELNELNWERKQTLDNVYGNEATRTFFLGDILDSTKIIDDTEEQVESLGITHKDKYEDVIKDLNTVVHSSFDYYDYSEQDESNKRFLTKQENTNKLKDTLFNNIPEEDQDNKSKDIEKTLFEGID